MRAKQIVQIVKDAVRRKSNQVDGTDEEITTAHAAFTKQFGHPPAKSIARNAGAMNRWTTSGFKAAPADPGVGYDKSGKPFPKK